MRTSRLLTPVLAILFAANIDVEAQRNRFIDREVTIPAGTLMHVRLDNTIGSDMSRLEDPVHGSLANAIVVDGRAVVPAGSRVLGSVTTAQRPGRVKGRAQVGVRFHELIPARSGERYDIRTRTWTAVAPGTKKRDAFTVGIPAGAGALIGGLTKGKKGAGLGALIGGGAGTGVVLATRGKDVRVGRGRVLLVRLTSPVVVDLS